MNAFLIVMGLSILGALLFIIYKLLNPKEEEKDDQAQKLMLDLMENLRKEVNENSSKSREEIQKRVDKMMESISTHQERTQESLRKQFTSSEESVRKQFAQSSVIIKEVTKKLTELDSTNKQVVNFAEQMKSLENILKNPKQRGILGEYFLEALLGNVLQPGQYKMQYKFTDGEIVDAVVFFNDKIIPIDAKFSLEKYNMIMQENDKIRREKLEKEFKTDLKNRIDETSKYIRPHENTTEFAFMFLPAEGIYYNLLVYNVGTIGVNTQDLVEYAFRKKVIIVSPTSFFAYLETVLQGLKALKMEESVKDIIKKVYDLGRHLNSYEDSMSKMGTHLSNTVGAFNNSSKEFRKIDKDIYRITDGDEGGKYDALLLDKPLKE